MATTKKTVIQLAQEAKIDTDEALVSLWDVGFDNLCAASDTIGKRELNRARRALGIATRRDYKSFEWWRSRLELTEKEFVKLLEKLDIYDKKKLRLSPKAIMRLKSYSRGEGIDPHTGTEYVPPSYRKEIEQTSFDWPQIGHLWELRLLSSEEILSIHFELVKDFSRSRDPIIPPGVRCEQLLESAAFRPHTSLNGIFKYPTVEMATAALLHSIILDHPFHNGNKRTALVSVLVFLDKNGLFPNFNEDEAFKLVLQVAQHRITNPNQDNLSDREVVEISKWLQTRTRVIEKGERTLCYRKLSRILTGFNCELKQVPGSGSKVSITRTIEKRRSYGGIFDRLRGRRHSKTLHGQLSYSGDGREISKGVIKKLRESLELDEKHGIDSHAFYDNQPTLASASDFITRYRKTLDRLAKF